MSLDKSIEHNKDYRKPYYRAGRFDPTCRPGGTCPYCVNSRLHSRRKKEIRAKEEIKEFKNNAYEQ